MNALDVLVSEYPGDAAWRHFVEVFQPAWAVRPGKDKFLAAIGNTEMAVVLAAILDDQAVPWFDRTIGALDGRSPREVLRNDPNGETALRTLVMRLP